jgi:hypothetical protein
MNQKKGDFEMKKFLMQKMMDKMMQKMMPPMMNQMQEKGINMFEMMRMMCPKCVSVATSQASDEDKDKLKSDMTEVFSKI